LFYADLKSKLFQFQYGAIGGGMNTLHL